MREIPYFCPNPIPNSGRWHRRDSGSQPSGAARAPWRRRPQRACRAVSTARTPPSSAARANTPRDRGYSPCSAPRDAGGTSTRPPLLRICLTIWKLHYILFVCPFISIPTSIDLGILLFLDFKVIENTEV